MTEGTPYRPKRAAAPAPDEASDFDAAVEYDTTANNDNQGSPQPATPDSSDSATPAKLPRRRSRAGMAMATVAFALVVVLGLGYATYGLFGRDLSLPTPPLQDPTTSPSEPASILTEEQLITIQQASLVDDSATWAVARTQMGRDEQAPTAICLPVLPADGPQPGVVALRTLTGSERGLQVLHEANSFADVEAAKHVFSQFAQELGGCDADGAYIVSSTTVDGVGNQALTVSVDITIPGQEATVHHTVLVARTGNVIDVLDLASTEATIAPGKAADTMAALINEQCMDADGLCSTKPATTGVVPPIGGDAPGLPVLADIPRLPEMTGHWSATPPARNPTLPEGSQCERLAAPSMKPTATLSRTYLVADDGTIPNTYGWDLVLLTMANSNQAGQYVGTIKSSVESCGDRQQTAEVNNPKSFTGKGTNNIGIAAQTWTVRQRTGTQTNQFIDWRVAIAQAGNKVIYLSLPVQNNVNFTDAQWQSLVLRAGERATQVK